MCTPPTSRWPKARGEDEFEDRIAQAGRACLANGRRLLDDVEFLEFNEPPSTAYFLSMIAQEECAKGFLLALVARGVIPWDRRLLRAARDHTCKQLLCVVMDYLSPDTEDFLERCNAVVLRVKCDTSLRGSWTR